MVAILVQAVVMTASAQEAFTAKATDESLFRFIINRGRFSPRSTGRLDGTHPFGIFLHERPLARTADSCQERQFHQLNR